MKTKAKARAAAKRQPKDGAEAVAPKAAEYRRERREIGISLLKVAPWNPRGKITPESVADLAASIRTLGVIQPLVAMLDKYGNATLVAGHRRLVAAKLAGLESVPCDILKGVDEETAKRMTFIENLQRKDADPLLESELVGGLVKSGMTQAEISAETGRGREWVARRMNLANLSKSWRKRVKDGEQITTDCLEHVAAYPDEVQERLKSARGYNGSGALRWSEIRSQFDRETCDLKAAKFDRTVCRQCPNNSGCSPDLFDWEGRVTAFGKCLNPSCYRHLSQLAIQKAKDDAKNDGLEVRELKDHPDYYVRLQDKRDPDHNTLYIWKDYNGEPQMQWGQNPQTGSPGGEMTEEQKEARRKKIAANKARRKLSEWCGENLAGAISARYCGCYHVGLAWAFQFAFDIGNTWQLFGSRTTNKDAAALSLVEWSRPNAETDKAPENWPEAVSDAIAQRIVKPEIGAQYAELVCALFSEARDALTAEELALVVTAEKLEKLQHPERVKWAKSKDEDTLDDEPAVEEDDETESEGDDE